MSYSLSQLVSNRSVKAVFFDLDGTLVDSVGDIARALSAAFPEQQTLTVDLVRQWVGEGSSQMIRQALKYFYPEQEITDPMIQARFEPYADYYVAHPQADSQLYGGVVETLEQLAELGLQQAIVTNKAARFTQPLVQALGIKPYFAEVVAGDTTAERKPSALPITFCCQQLGLKPEEILFVGDSLTDCRAAHAAAVPMLAVSYGYHQGVDLKSQPAVVACVDDLSTVQWSL